MSPVWGHALGGVTVLLLLILCAVWIWIWLPHHKQAFDALARLPMGDGGVPDPRIVDKP